MVRCLILVGPEKWCLNHTNVIRDHGESWLLYDKYPIQESDKNRINDMMRKGGFQTFIYLSQNWGGDGKIEFVAYTPPTKGDRVLWSTENDEFYLDHELIPETNKKIRAGRSERNARSLKPKKPPGFTPKWDYYDFGVSRKPILIKNIKNYIDDHLPRSYNVAVKITDIQRIEKKELTQFHNFNNSDINTGQLLNSFIVAQTKNDYRNKFNWK